MTRAGYDVVVIGGGIVGLALADAWLARNSGGSLLVLDKASDFAAHASGRNSGVLHAGFYYAPDSLKARLTRRGNELMRIFCEERGVSIRETGKVVVVQSDAQLPALDQLMRRGQANGVPLEMVDATALRELEPLARTVDRAIWSPTTAVAHPSDVVKAVAERVRERGGAIRLAAEVVAARPGVVHLRNGDSITSSHIINAAGLYADRVGHWFGVGNEYRMLPFKGLYWYGSWEPGRLRRHVYPVPDPRNPFLGVHLTVTVEGKVKIGPTAIPALWREDYGGFTGFSAAEVADILRTYPSFLTSPHHDVPGLIRDELPKYRRTHLIRQAQALVPSVEPGEFRIKGRPGVRAQLVNVPERRLEMDFVVRQGEGSTHILNAVSPAWTSALAVAEHVVDGMTFS